MRIDVIYSRDDGGWYAEVYVTVTGRTEYTSRVYATKDAARRAAERWIRRQVATGM